MKFVIYLLGLSICFYSCQKVVNLKLNTSSSQIVIVGKISDQIGVDTVTITKSVNFSDPNVFPQVSGAKVYLADNDGNKDTLLELIAGKYITKSTFKGIIGRTYTLTVISEGQSYVAESTIPNAVKIDSIYIGTNTNGGFGGGGGRGGNEKAINVVFTDQPNFLNYYNLVEYVNKVEQNSNTISDHLLDGNSITRSLRAKNLIKGDTITVKLEGIDSRVYEYFRTSGRANTESAMPANPVSNFSNNALGYFNAYSVSKKTIVIK
jgi:hypothetical protein